jgi:hypothetical protein
MRLKSVGSISLIVAAFTVGSAFAAQAPTEIMVAGLWEITLQTKSPLAGPPITHTVCVERPLLTSPDPPRSKAKDDCHALPDPAAPNETAYTVRCTKSKVTSSSKVKYLGDHFEGTITIHNDQGDIQQTLTGTRVGDCEETTPAPPIPTPPAGQD